MRIYFIGAGVIALTHAETAVKIANTYGQSFEFRVADLNPHALEQFNKIYPNALTYPNAQSMLSAEPSQPDDIVIVCTPPFNHHSSAMLGFASKRHVLCEKPLAMNAREAEEMVQAAEQAGKLLGCCSVRFKGMNHSQVVKSWLQSNRLGEIYHMTFIHKWHRSRPGIEYQPASRWFTDRSKSAGGILVDWAPYDWNTLDELFVPEEVEIHNCWMAQPSTASDPKDVVFDVETHVGAHLTIKSQGKSIPVQYERASCMHGKEQVLVEIEGSLGAIRWMPFDSGQPIYVTLDEQGQAVEQQLDMAPDNAWSVMERPLHDFYTKMRGDASVMNVNRQALNPFLCIQAMYECKRTGQSQKVTFNRK
jgi:predicted dehydrogenase